MARSHDVLDALEQTVGMVAAHERKNILFIVPIHPDSKVIGIREWGIENDESVEDLRLLFEIARLEGDVDSVMFTFRPTGTVTELAESDIALTHRLAEAGRLEGIPLFDVILTDEGMFRIMSQMFDDWSGVVLGSGANYRKGD
jgi:hypothetical protein